ncbi:MAG TPA: AsmA-like C-terminal region-containing protein, partial [Candidatus Ozemobacteraceae bacterium]|nr:AsmA-like C-terminal region-containing protein [Candidatus Ozemobacteraceae bacterium]
ASTFKFPLTDLRAPFVLSEGVLAINGFKARSFDGALEGSGKIFLKETPLRFAFDTKATQLMVQNFLALNTSLKNALTGGLDFQLKMQGNTTGLDSVQGESDIHMKNGKYQAPPVAAQIFEVLQAPQLASGDITGAQGHFVIKDGRMNSNDLLFRSRYGSLGYAGTVGLDTSLDGTAKIELTQEACQMSTTLRQLAGSKKSLTLPASVKGSLLSPKVGLKIEDLLKEAAKQKLQDTLLDAVMKGGKKEPSASGSSTIASESASPATPQDLLMQQLGKKIGIKLPGQTTTAPAPTPAPPAPAATSTTPVSVASGAVSIPPASGTAVPAPETKPTKVKDVGNEIKKIGKDLKKIFKW